MFWTAVGWSPPPFSWGYYEHPVSIYYEHCAHNTHITRYLWKNLLYSKMRGKHPHHLYLMKKHYLGPYLYSGHIKIHERYSGKLLVNITLKRNLVKLFLWQSAHITLVSNIN